jgi:hypothetical protein
MSRVGRRAGLRGTLGQLTDTWYDIIQNASSASRYDVCCEDRWGVYNCVPVPNPLQRHRHLTGNDWVSAYLIG